MISTSSAMGGKAESRLGWRKQEPKVLERREGGQGSRVLSSKS